MTVHQFIDQDSLRRAAVAGVLEEMCRSLEPSPTQINEAKTRYEAVGQWLSGGSDLGLQRLSIYLQGSTALGTVVRPLHGCEYDVDLVSHIAGRERRAPSEIKSLIGDRLKEHGQYQRILVEKPRCWRLDYANEFHLDITPSIENPACPNGGELVPDRKLKCWKASNPKGYRALFEKRAAIEPSFRIRKLDDAAARAGIEPYPDAPRFKSILCRIVQIVKRHRDVYFEHRDDSLAPISIVLTTLAMRAYEHCALHKSYDSELGLLLDVIEVMPHFIQQNSASGRLRWFVWNETTVGENFAERWNDNPNLAAAFYQWHAKLVADLDRLGKAEGIDRLGRELRDSFGDRPAAQAIAKMENEYSSARAEGKLYAAPRVGLIAAAGAAAMASATAVKANTFHGADDE